MREKGVQCFVLLLMTCMLVPATGLYAQCVPDVPPAQPVYTLGGRMITVSNVSIDGGGTTALMNPGQSFNVSFDWTIGPNYTACPGCVTFFHFGLSNVNVPGSPSATTYPNTHCMGSVFANQNSSSSGSFTAPTDPGFYYITLVSKWVFWCHQYPVNHCNDKIIALIQVGTPTGLSVEVDSVAGLSGCDTDDGYVGIIVDNYTGCFTSSWTGPDGFTSNASTSISNLAAGDYTVTVTDISGCDTTLLFTVDDVLSELVDLGPDTTLCAGESILLDATVPGVAYLWQDGSTQPTYTVNAPGTYAVQVSANNCTTTDTIVVDYIDPQPDLGPDVLQCGGSVVLDPGIAASAYAWQDGSTGPQYTAGQSGTYWVDVTVYRCTERDSIHLAISQPFSVDLGADTSICGGTLQLNTGVPGGSEVWLDGSTGPGFTVTSSGQYGVTVDRGECSDSDTITVTIDIPATLDLGPDTTLCSGTITLDATVPGAMYMWQDGSATPVYTVDTSGLYSVVVTPAGSCPPLTDAVTVTYLDPPDTPMISDTTLCDPGQYIVSVNNSGDAIQWWNGASQNSQSIDEDGTYWVTVSNVCGASTDSFTVVLEACGCTMAVPTAFSPDNNGFNDIFLPLISCETLSYRMRVYNRWGELLFESDDPDLGWTGRWKGKLMEMDTYSWLIEYTPAIQQGTPEVRFETGTILLFR